MPAAYAAGILVATAARTYGKNNAINAPVPGRGREANVLIQAALRTETGRSMAKQNALSTEG
eukprot:11165683-Lingulodinium_polyedra.AAC.1